MLVDTSGNRYFAHGASTDIPSTISPNDLGLNQGDRFVRSSDIQALPQTAAPGQAAWFQNHAEQKLLRYANQENTQPAEMHSVYKFCSNRGGSIQGCEEVLARQGFKTVSPQLQSDYPIRFTNSGIDIIRKGMR